MIQLQFISICSKKENNRNWSTFISAVKDWLKFKGRQKDGNELLEKTNKQQNTGNQSANTLQQKKNPRQGMEILVLNTFKCTSLENSALVKEILAQFFADGNTKTWPSGNPLLEVWFHQLYFSQCIDHITVNLLPILLYLNTMCSRQFQFFSLQTCKKIKSTTASLRKKLWKTESGKN